MDKITTEFFIGELSKLRSSVFEALNSMRIELGTKIDASASEHRSQIEDLQHHGCFRGQMQDKDISDLKTIVSRMAASPAPSEADENNGKKKVNIGIGKLKLAFAGFKASDVIMILMAILLGIVLIGQQKTITRLDTVERGFHRTTHPNPANAPLTSSGGLKQ